MTRLSSELQLLREMLMHKFGREFSVAVMENRDECVPARVRGDLVRKVAENTDAWRKRSPASSLLPLPRQNWLIPRYK